MRSENFDNNLKIERRQDSFYKRIFLPQPHGVSTSNLDEFRAFSKHRWGKEFQEAGFDMVAILKGPISSGYGLGLNTITELFEKLGLASEYIYVAIKKGHVSPYRQYFH